MFYHFDLCLGFCALLVCIAYAYISTHHSGPRLYHHLLGIGMVVVTNPFAIWVEASGKILYLFTILRCCLCFGFGMRRVTVFCALLLCAVYGYISTLHSAPSLSHQLLAVGMVAASSTVTMWVEAIGNILYLSSTLRRYLCLAVGMFGGTTVLYILTQLLGICFILAGDFVSLVFLAYVFLCFGCRRRYSKKRRLRYRSLGSYNWSRRRVFWLQKKISRTEYVALASKNKSATKSLEIRPTQTTCAPVVASFANSSKAAVTGKRKEKTTVRRKTLNNKDLQRTRSSTRRESPFPFFVSPKRIKKRIEFRRRTSNLMDNSIDPLRGTDPKSKKPRSAPRTNKQRCQPKRPKLRKQTSVPEVKHKPPPSYHVSYTKALEAYKTLRKGKTFHASKKVIWRNRYHLLLNNRYKKEKLYNEGWDLHPYKEKEYYVPEPPEEDEDPQWVDTGSEYPSDAIGDGPVHDQSHLYTCGPGPSSYSIVTVGKPLLKVQLKEPLMTGNKTAENTSQEYHVPKPREENEDPQWILTGPEYSSDYAGDGPHSSEEYDPEKDKARNRKRKQAKALQKWRRKRKQRDSEHRSNEFNTRTKRRQTGIEVRNRSGDVKRKAQKRKDGDIDRNDEFKQRSRKRRSGQEPRNRSGDVRRKSQRREDGDIDRKDEFKQRSRKRQSGEEQRNLSGDVRRKSQRREDGDINR